MPFYLPPFCAIIFPRKLISFHATWRRFKRSPSRGERFFVLSIPQSTIHLLLPLPRLLPAAATPMQDIPRLDSRCVRIVLFLDARCPFRITTFNVFLWTAYRYICAYYSIINLCLFIVEYSNSSTFRVLLQDGQPNVISS